MRHVLARVVTVCANFAFIDPIDNFDSPDIDISNMIDQILKEVEINVFNCKYEIQ